MLSLNFMTPSTSTPFCNNAMQIVEKQVYNKEMLQADIFGVVKHPIEIQIENKKLENEKKKAEEQEQKEIEKNDEPEWQEFVLTYYTSLNSENGYGSITCTGSKLYDGLVASNYYKLNTKIQLQGWGEVTVGDRGGSNFNNDFRLDVFVPKNPNESDSHYFKRVNNMGKVKVKGRIVK